eukprot:CAMPEP_0119270502 /NCGR_PEP_ID=MMETSP1329-20130426/7481_1 /TAXON_ID=114041 /ORGANISM="Genus nov. species nov., Strain RCC1024" /LENGTH=94 /DNA_ID=CAMNT_0007270525 /DNA_START=133 /DNA_END=414 /DNA_ORIENTATION=+
MTTVTGSGSSSRARFGTRTTGSSGGPRTGGGTAVMGMVQPAAAAGRAAAAAAAACLGGCLDARRGEHEGPARAKSIGIEREATQAPSEEDGAEL